MPAVWRRCHVLYEEVVPLVRAVVCERQIQCTLHLPAELPCLPFGLSAGGQTIRRSSIESVDKLLIHETGGPFRTTISVFQDKAPLRAARVQTRPRWPSTWLLSKAMGAGPAGRVIYAAASRLDGIGRRAIGDMVSSAGCVEWKGWPLQGDRGRHYRATSDTGAICERYLP